MMWSFCFEVSFILYNKITKILVYCFSITNDWKIKGICVEWTWLKVTFSESTRWTQMIRSRDNCKTQLLPGPAAIKTITIFNGSVLRFDIYADNLIFMRFKPY